MLARFAKRAMQSTHRRPRTVCSPPIRLRCQWTSRVCWWEGRIGVPEEAPASAGPRV